MTRVIQSEPSLGLLLEGPEWRLVFPLGLQGQVTLQNQEGRQSREKGVTESKGIISDLNLNVPKTRTLPELFFF